MTAMQTTAQTLANPTRFMSLSGSLLPWIGSAAAVVLACGLYLALFSRRQTGRADRQDHVHPRPVGVAGDGRLFDCDLELRLLVFRHPLADVSAKAAVPLGAAFTFIALVTGALWGRRCGAYWVDARLTSC